MSLESYKKALAAQREREREYRAVAEPKKAKPAQAREVEYVYVTTKPRKKRHGCLIFILIIVALIVVSVIKNPSEQESKELVKDFVVEKINKYLRNEMTNEDNDPSKFFGAMIGLALSSSLVDYACETEVDDYVIFSTFDCTAELEKSNKTVVAGIIFCGKVIPLKTEIDKDHLEDLFESK